MDTALTPNQVVERVVSAARELDLSIRREVDLATEEQIRAVVFLDVSYIARRMEISRPVAARFRREARRRVMNRWADEELEK